MEETGSKRYAKRSSLPVNKKKSMRQESFFDLGKDCTKVSEYLSIKKWVGHLGSESSSEKRFIQESQDDKIFSSKEVSKVICSSI